MIDIAYLLHDQFTQERRQTRSIAVIIVVVLIIAVVGQLGNIHLPVEASHICIFGTGTARRTSWGGVYEDYLSQLSSGTVRDGESSSPGRYMRFVVVDFPLTSFVPFSFHFSRYLSRVFPLPSP